MILFPAIDLRGGCCVRLTQGLDARATVYPDDPLQVAWDFQSQGAAWLHVVDLDAAMDEVSANREIVSRIVSELSIPVQVGGGLRTEADMERVFEAGAARAVVGSAAVEQPDVLRAAVNRWGERIAVAVDARAGRIATHGWKQSATAGLAEFVQGLEQCGVARIIYTDVQRDGGLGGPAVDSTLEMARGTTMRVIASGGVAALVDLVALAAAGGGFLEGAIVGKALYEGRFTLREALLALASQ